jgi:hypothetical protein
MAGRKMRTISSAREAIEVLGGHKAVAAWLGTSSDSVLMMRHRGYIARGYHLHFYLTLKERGFQMAPSLFGLDTFERLLMPKLRVRKRRDCGLSGAAA